MHKLHSEFFIDKTAGKPIWRYMDFWKFLNLITTSKLYFPNVTMLGDQYEGRIPQKMKPLIIEEYIKSGRNEKMAKDYMNFIENELRHRTLVSSWTASHKESFAMWKMYSKDKLGIAIKTDYDSLAKAFQTSSEDIYIGEVIYYDDEHPFYKIGNTFFSFLVKNNYYDFESEVRCIAEIEHSEDASYKNIDVNLQDLIKELYISPLSEKTGILEIIEFLKEKYSLSFEVKISGVHDTWI